MSASGSPFNDWYDGLFARRPATGRTNQTPEFEDRVARRGRWEQKKPSIYFCPCCRSPVKPEDVEKVRELWDARYYHGADAPWCDRSEEMP